MCGRIVVARPTDVLAGFFGVTDVVAGEREPSWNVTPGAEILAVAGTRSGRRLGTMGWGLVPSWLADPAGGPRPINARVETIVDNGMFAESLARRRCLVVVDGFYEWRRPVGGPKQPYYLDLADGSEDPFALAGIWDRNAGAVTCAVVTCPADENLTWLHDRMPVRLAPDRWDAWLDPAAHDVDELLRLLHAGPAVPLRARPVGPRVNSARNDGPDLVTVLSGETQPQLL
ncbi:MAG TPA: SOS response-associated peptidase [Acidimicrobiales bacterium]|jgi:putative SOS response-associated peptidase YedK|nr:SOS response-associated peptidase [Acidimicrobiales bacterium]